MKHNIDKIKFWVHEEDNIIVSKMYFRCPKTHSQLKIDQEVIYEDKKLKLRAKQNSNNTITSWDDIRLSRTSYKSWKDHSKRKKQYKVIRQP